MTDRIHDPKNLDTVAEIVRLAGEYARHEHLDEPAFAVRVADLLATAKEDAYREGAIDTARYWEGEVEKANSYARWQRNLIKKQILALLDNQEEV